MAKFSLNQILNEASKNAAPGGGDIKPRPTESRMEKLSVFDIEPSEDNFYSMREIEELKTAIEIAGKVLQNLVVVPNGNGKYKALAGHRRRLASIALVEEGKPQYEFVPCEIEPNEEAAEDQEIRDGLTLIVTNSQREKTAWDKIEEVRYLREVLEKAKTKPRFVDVLRQIVATVFGGGEVQADGTRDFLAKVLHTTPAQIGRYDGIIRHLSAQFKEELREDRINLSTAVELSGLCEEDQQAAFEEYRENGTISIKDAKARKPAQPEPEQPEKAPPAPSSPPEVLEAAEQLQQEEAQEQQDPPAESAFRQQDPPKPKTQEQNTTAQPEPNRPGEKHEQECTGPDPLEEEQPEEVPPAPSSTPAATFGEQDETTIAIRQLESLCVYCQTMHESDTDDGSRVWALDVDALELAIAKLKQG